VPQVVLIDPEVCLNFKRGTLTDKCKKTCVEACGDRPSTFKQKEEIKEIKVGTIIVATGFQTFDAKRTPAVRLRRLSRTSTRRWRSSAWSTPPARPAAR
jgi:heterodisulfide reductase subunit A-like polyferredoxin